MTNLESSPIERSAHNSLPWLVSLVLLSGAGLLTFAVIELWGAVRNADRNARREAQARAEQVASAARDLLAEPSVLNAMPENWRFTVAQGAVEVPPAVVWLTEPPAPFQESVLPLRAGVLLQRSRRAEWIAKDVDAAVRLLGEAMAVPGLSDAARAHLLREAGWQAARRGQREQVLCWWLALARSPALDPANAGAALRLAIAERLGETEADRAGPAATELLAARARVEALALALPASVPLGSDFEPRREAIVARRRVLSRVASLPNLRHGEMVENSAAGPGAAGQSADDRAPESEPWVVLLPGAEGAPPGTSVAGALLPLASLANWLGGAAASGSLGFAELPAGWDPQWGRQLDVRGAAASADAVVILGDLVVVPRRPPTPIWANPVLLVGVLLLTALCFGSGLYFSFRAVLRESAAMRSKADFLTSVTHELKTPLSSIRLLSEMLEEGRVVETSRKQEYYRLLAGESARLTALIENVLDLGRMERGERSYDLQTAELDGVVAAAVDVFRPVGARDGMTIDLNLGAPGCVAEVDRGALVQAFLNVMDNARKYALAGERLEMTSTLSNEGYRLTVRDFGSGIPEAEREQVFARFVRGVEEKSGAVAGVGLGLYLARGILQAHGGTLRYSAPDGVGAAFEFYLPTSATRTAQTTGVSA